MHIHFFNYTLERYILNNASDNAYKKKISYSYVHTGAYTLFPLYKYAYEEVLVYINFFSSFSSKFSSIHQIRHLLIHQYMPYVSEFQLIQCLIQNHL